MPKFRRKGNLKWWDMNRPRWAGMKSGRGSGSQYSRAVADINGGIPEGGGVNWADTGTTVGSDRFKPGVWGDGPNVAKPKVAVREGDAMVTRNQWGDVIRSDPIPYKYRGFAK